MRIAESRRILIAEQDGNDAPRSDIVALAVAEPFSLNKGQFVLMKHLHEEL
jgi:hypothetical protein